MMSLNVHGIQKIEVEKTHKVFPNSNDSFARRIKITTDELVMDIVLFADKAEKLEGAGVIK